MPTSIQQASTIQACVAPNLRRLLAMGLTSQNGTWALA